MAVPNLDYLLHRAVVDIVVERELRALLESGEKLRLKMGFDPSRPDLHLGYAVALRKLRQFQELGHQVILIVGDWTARIGDPTGRSETRQMLTEEQVNENAQSYMRQFFKIVDREKTQVVFQSEWFDKFSLADVVQLTAKFTVAQMLAREDFAQRYASQRPIALVEFLYPLLQGYDSVAIRSDVEFGGSDQKFNCLVGRDMQGMEGQRPQQVLLTPLLLGTDGRKMSQSYGNFIAFETPPKDMYGRVMSIPDNIMMDYFELLTDVPDQELAEMRRALETQSVNPMEFKHRLAKEIVTFFHGAEDAWQAEDTFRRVVQRGAVPEDMPTIKIQRILAPIGSLTIDLRLDQRLPRQDPIVGPRLAAIDLITALATASLVESKSEARRLINQGAVSIIDPDLSERVVDLQGVAVKDGTKIQVKDVEPQNGRGIVRVRDGTLVNLEPGSIIRVGKRRFVKLVE